MIRRGFLFGALGLLAAPAIVRVTSIMPVKAMPPALLDLSDSNVVHYIRYADPGFGTPGYSGYDPINIGPEDIVCCSPLTGLAV